MKRIETALGDFHVISAKMERASGYGQYTIKILGALNRHANVELKQHSTDSQLFDKLTDLDSYTERAEYLLENKMYTIERMVEDYINSL